MEQVNNERLKQEISSGFKPLALDAGLSVLPFGELDDRDFENLIYCLVGAETKLGEYGTFDEVVLMKGVGERGRDCLLYSAQRLSGVIQCKKIKTRIPRPALIKELVKFLLFSLLDKDLMPENTGFEYHLYASGGLSEPAQKLASSFSNEIEVEISNGCLAGYMQQVIEDYESFAEFESAPPLGSICKCLRGIIFKSFDGTNLNARLATKNDVLASFFQVRLVVEHEAVKDYFRQEFEAAGLNILTDESLKSLHARLTSVDKSSKIGFGTLDMYGYSVEYVKYLGTDGFSELIKRLLEFKSYLDNNITKFLTAKIGDLIYEDLTRPFVREGLILPFTASVIHQYVLRRVLPIVIHGSLPEKILLMVAPTAKSSPDEILKMVADENISSQKKVGNGDYSHLPNPDPDREKRLWLLKSLRAGCSIRNLEERFWKDMKKVRRLAESICTEALEGFAGPRTVIIKDSAFLSDPVEMKRVMGSIKQLESVSDSNHD